MGNMGRTHVNELRKMPEVEIVALCSMPLDDAILYNRQNGTNYPVFEDFDRMLDEAAFDALYVCLPPFAHDGQIEKAAAKGIHIFAEKPLALDVERGQSIADAVKKANVKSMMGYHMRFGGAVEKLVQLMESGEAGRPTLFVANYECNSLHTPWWIDVKKCGGQVFEQVIHLYDMAYYIMGKADSVTGYVANLCHQDTPGYTVEDTSSVAIRFQSGALGSITGSNCAVPGKWRGIFKIVFQNMVVEFQDFNNMKITRTKGEVTEETLSFDTNVRFEENRRFVDVLLGKVPEFAPIAEGFDGLKMVAAAVVSSGNGGAPVKLS
jgi:predicted dehydrogenase